MFTLRPMIAPDKNDLEKLDVVIPNETEAAELLGLEEVSGCRAAGRENLHALGRCQHDHHLQFAQGFCVVEKRADWTLGATGSLK